MDWDAVNNAESIEELNRYKEQLLEESLRLRKEAEYIGAQKKRTEEEREELIRVQNSFMKDRVRLRDELDELNRRTLAERKRLKEENLFFDKKMAILQAGFRDLEEDKARFLQEKKSFYANHETKSDNYGFGDISLPVDFDENDLDTVAEILFGTATNPLVIRKRYKDLVKIYHPDNFYGDEALVAAINRVYQKRRNSL